MDTPVEKIISDTSGIVSREDRYREFFQACGWLYDYYTRIGMKGDEWKEGEARNLKILYSTIGTYGVTRILSMSENEFLQYLKKASSNEFKRFKRRFNRRVQI